MAEAEAILGGTRVRKLEEGGGQEGEGWLGQDKNVAYCSYVPSAVYTQTHADAMM